MDKKKFAKLVASVLAIVMLAGCSVFSTDKEPDPLEVDENYTGVLLEFMRNVDERNFDALRPLIAPESDAPTSDDPAVDFLSRNTNIYSGIDASNIQVNVKRVEEIELDKGDTRAAGRRITYHLTMDTLAGEVAFDHTAEVYAYKEEKDAQPEFLLLWDTSIIFPSLGATDKVRVFTDKGVRGNVYDRNGLMLAGNGDVKAVGFVPGKMGDDPQAVIQQAAEILNMTPESIQNKLNASWVRDDHFVELRKLATTDIERIDALLEIPGILINTVTERVYPYGAATAHLTGYIGDISAEELEARAGQGYSASSRIGKVGVEALLEERIRGIDGCRIMITDSEGNEKQILAHRAKVDGESVTLTIDAAMQNMLYEQLKEDKSAIVVMNHQTGEILTLMSTPAYDPNAFVLGLESGQWEGWRDDERNPMYNRFKASIVPGSSFKPIIAAIGLETGAFTADENFGYGGRSWQKDSSWGGYTVTTLIDSGGPVTLTNAMMNSDNIYFSKAALKIGAEQLASELERIGFGEAVPFMFGTTASSFGNNHVFEGEIELADSGHGQGRVLINPIHMASMYSAFTNDGDMITPYLEMKPTPSAEVWIDGAFQSDVVHTVRDAMTEVVENPAGTAYTARVEGMRLAGKTGTAEIKDSKDDETGTEMGWYCAYTLDENTSNSLLFIGMVEDVKDRGGSHYLFPMGQSVFRYLQQHPYA